MNESVRIGMVVDGGGQINPCSIVVSRPWPVPEWRLRGVLLLHRPSQAAYPLSIRHPLLECTGLRNERIVPTAALPVTFPLGMRDFYYLAAN